MKRAPRPPSPRPSTQTNHSTRGEPVRVAGKVIGYLEGTVFCKRVRRSRHFHRALQSWAHDLASLEELSRLGCETFQVQDTESGTIYRTSLDNFLSRGIRRDYGHGLQVFLPERYWHVTDPNQLDLFVPAEAMAQ